MFLKKFNFVVGLLAISGMMMADVNLTADTDWSEQGTITVPAATEGSFV